MNSSMPEKGGWGVVIAQPVLEYQSVTHLPDRRYSAVGVQPARWRFLLLDPLRTFWYQGSARRDVLQLSGAGSGDPHHWLSCPTRLGL